MEKFSLKFHMDDCETIDDLAALVSEWEQHTLARSENPALSEKMRMYNLGLADMAQAVRLQFVRLQVGIKPLTRSL